jgi:urocanate hydratase
MLLPAPFSKKWLKLAPIEIQQQMQITFNGSRHKKNKLVVGSQARILYADAEGRVKSPAIRLLPREIGTVVLGRDHRCVWNGFPYRKSNIYDGSRLPYGDTKRDWGHWRYGFLSIMAAWDLG